MEQVTFESYLDPGLDTEFVFAACIQHLENVYD